ncbi:MAG: hypothetical protein KGY80_06500 [Candidatus Thorarchaeota archaeon]|nr:hypothetical protein [Candidatus Thorarchaeota archaeon]
MPERSGKYHSRRTGTYYTPAEIADYITKKSIGAWINERAERTSEMLTSVRVLDPAVGNGVFLLAAAEQLLQQRCRLTEVKDTGQLRGSILSTNLFGVDLRENAVQECRTKLASWAQKTSHELPRSSLQEIVQRQIRKGNSLVGSANSNGQQSNTFKESCNEHRPIISSMKESTSNPLSWSKEFPQVFKNPKPGFDIILGNPPFGNILTSFEKEYIQRKYDAALFGGRRGTWNIAAHFLARANALLKEGGEIAFILPNSIMRTKQFSKTRAFLAGKLGVWMIVDEGSPFQDVTLEMVSVFCSRSKSQKSGIIVMSRRPGIHIENVMPRSTFQDGGIAVLYHDDLFDRVVHKGITGHISATRGRDIPSEHVSENRSDLFSVPYPSSGRSVRRYRFDRKYFKYAEDSYLDEQNLQETKDSRFLLATKNKAYPRCVLKPKGMIHGGGVVSIAVHNQKMNPKVLGLILNSRMIRYLCVRYLTNYSKLTTCLNTGIIEEIPIVYPDIQRPYIALFEFLQNLHRMDSHSQEIQRTIESLDRIADALVYELYLGVGSTLVEKLDEKLENRDNQSNPFQTANSMISEEISKRVKEVLNNSEVLQIENSPKMGN